MPEFTRREALAATGAALSGSLAGCSGTLDSITGGGKATPQAGWLGPATASTLSETPYGGAEVSFVTTAIGMAALAESAVNSDFRDRWLSQTEFETVGGVSVPFEPDRVDEWIYDPMKVLQIVEGGIDAPSVIDTLKSAGATLQTTHDGRDIYAQSFEPANPSRYGYSEDADVRLWEAFGVGEDEVVCGTQGPAVESVVSLVTALVDTRSGDAERFAESDERTAAVAELLDDGFYSVFEDFGKDEPGGVSLTLDGEAVRRQVVHYGAESEVAATYRDRMEKTVPRNGSAVAYGTKYIDHEVRTTENCAVFEGTMPASQVTLRDVSTWQ